MPYWVNSLSFAVLLVTIPFTFVLKMLFRLPKPLALCHRRWPPAANFAVIGAVTACATVFIRSAYYGHRSAAVEIFAAFFVAAVSYGFGLVLLLRQFSGVYAEYIVITGTTGLGLRKIGYRSVKNVETGFVQAGETELQIETVAEVLRFVIPTRYVSIFYDQLRKNKQDEDE